jgi:DNA-directed RNA polymerase specialized sigma24 family protein
MDHKLRKPPDDPDLFNSQMQSPELRPKLIKLARQKGVPIDDREDIVSEAFARAIASQEEYAPARGTLFSWISGITENVIRSYYRKLKAQKRKPDGGVISSDAASVSDEDNPLELADKWAEVRSKSAEDAQHYIDTAGLSEKEQGAIASRLDKDDKPSALKFGSSTGRRAMRKIQQARTDEEFRKSPQGPDASECAYGKIPAAERSAAVLFDELRRTPWFVDAITRWRKSPEWNNAQAFLQQQAPLKRFPLRILGEHWPELLCSYRQAADKCDNALRRRFEAAVEITLAFPEWPAVAYCQLAPKNDASG